MTVDVKVLQILDLLVQVALMIVVIVAITVARRQNIGRHCTIVRIAVLLQILSIGIIMLPSMVGYLEHRDLGPLFNAEILVHHSLGLAVIALWIYFNLVFTGTIRGWGRLSHLMWLAFGVWITTFILGLHLILVIFGTSTI
jgi:hypothetical protein